jgi:hypothetical protein
LYKNCNWQLPAKESAECFLYSNIDIWHVAIAERFCDQNAVRVFKYNQFSICVTVQYFQPYAWLTA